jgi:hypothetical protein
MAGIKLEEFRGVRPRAGHRLLDAREGTIAINLRLGSGELRPLRAAAADGSWTKVGTILSFFPFGEGVDRKWLHWPADVDVVRGPVPDTARRRIYYTGDGAPKITYDELIDAAVGTPGEYPRDWRYLGMPAPSNTLAVEATDFGTEGVITELLTPELTFLFGAPLLGDPKGLSQFIYIVNGGTRAEWTIFPPGAEYLVERANENTLRLYSLDGGAYLTEALETVDNWTYYYETSSGSNSSATPLTGTVAVPNGIAVTVENHGLRDGDVIRITSATVPLTLRPPTSFGVDPETDPAAPFYGQSGHIISSNPDTAVVEAGPGQDTFLWTGQLSYSVIRDESTASGRVVERSYVYTYVSPLGEEGPPSNPSQIVRTIEEDATRVSGFSVPTLPQRDIEFVRLYRANNSSTDAEFQFVDEIAAVDISGYTPETAADVDYGGTIALDAVPVALDGTTENTLVATVPVSAIKTRRATPVTLILEISDSDEVLDSPTMTDFVAPNWQIDFQYSTNGSLWLPIASRTVIGVAFNTEEDTVPVSYTGAMTLNSTVIQQFDISSVAVEKGDDVQYRAVVELVAGSYNNPTVSLFTASEAEVTEPGEVGPAEYTYADDVMDEELGEVIQSTEWFPPDENMRGIVSMPNGILAGFFGRTVALCEPYYPHAWPPSYELHLDYDVVGLGVFGNSLLVATEGTPYITSGTHSRNMRAGLRRIEVNQACVSKKSIANIGSGVLYASPDGLAYASNSDFQIVTESYFSREEWQALSPESMLGFAHDQQYIGFFDNGGAQNAFILDPAKPEVGLSFTTADAVGGYEDLLTDTLYLSDGTNRTVWDGGDEMTYTWRSKMFAFPYLVNLAFARVVADAYPVTFRLYANGVLRHTRTVANDNEFRLPAGYLADRYYVELEGTADISAVFVGEAVEDVLGG